MTEIPSDPDAPLALVEAARAVRQIIVECAGAVTGKCFEASVVLNGMLRRQGLEAEIRGCFGGGDPHVCVRSGEWILDPTCGQWGEAPILVFGEDSPDDWYEPGGGGPGNFSEQEIVDRFAQWDSPGTVEPLLALAGLSHLMGPVERAIEALCAARAFPDADAARRDIAHMLGVLFARCREGYIEMRLTPMIPWAGAHPKEYIRLPNYERAAQLAVTKREDFEVYFGVAPRVDPPWFAEGCRHGGNEVAEVAAVWADVDDPTTVIDLVGFDLPPSVVVESGAPGHLHAYWVLEEPTQPAAAERVNYLLAQRLGSDPSVTKPGSALRLPGTLNRKREPYRQVRLVEYTQRRYSVEELHRAAA